MNGFSAARRLACSILLAVGAVAGETLPPTELGVTPIRISEVRNSGEPALFSYGLMLPHLTVTLSVTYNGLPGNVTVENGITVSSVIDDRNRALDTRNTIVVQSLPAGRPQTIELRISKSDRSALALKVIEGSIPLRFPLEQVVRVPNVMSHSGRSIEHPTLSKHGIDFRILADEASFAENAGLFKQGRTANDTPLPNEIAYYLRDPQANRTPKVFVSFELQDAAGGPLAARHTEGRGDREAKMGYLRFESPPPKDAQLVIVLHDGGTIKRVPFRFENIPLP